MVFSSMCQATGQAIYVLTKAQQTSGDMSFTILYPTHLDE